MGQIEVTMPKCYRCSQNFPRETLQPQRVFKGTNGKRRSTDVLMCAGCIEPQQADNKVVATVSLIAITVLAVVVIAVRGH